MKREIPLEVSHSRESKVSENREKRHETCMMMHQNILQSLCINDLLERGIRTTQAEARPDVFLVHRYDLKKVEYMTHWLLQKKRKKEKVVIQKTGRQTASAEGILPDLHTGSIRSSSSSAPSSSRNAAWEPITNRVAPGGGVSEK